MNTNTCAYCGTSFNHSRPEVDICEACFYQGRHHEKQLAGVLADLRQVNANAGITHTGGGCFAIEVPIGEARPEGSRYVLITDAEGELPDDDGTSEGQRWVVGFYDDQTDDSNALESIGFDQPPLTTQQALEYCFARDALEMIRNDKATDKRFEHWDGTWDGLHEIVDANDYLIAAIPASEEANPDRPFELIHNVEDLISTRLDEIQPQMCRDCWTPIVYGEDEAYHHTDADRKVRGCFLIPAEEAAS